MRSVAAAGVIALGFGCNSILGLDTVTLRPDAQPERIQITQQALTALPDVIEFPPLDGLDKIKLAPMDTPFDDHPCSEQAPPCTQSFDQVGFALPPSLIGQPYRMLYQPPGDIPHEVQWSFTAPHICVPYFGKAGQPAAPSNATIQIMATGGPGTFDAPLVFTYGRTWSAGPTQTSAPNPVDYAFTTSATPIEGPLATIQSGTDTAMLVDFTSGAATGGARFTVDLQADTTVPASGTWQAPAPKSIVFLKDTGEWVTRYLWMGATLVGARGPRSMIYAGVIPSKQMPAFAIRPLATQLDPLSVPMFTLAQLSSISGTDIQTAMFADPFDGTDNLSRAVAYQVNNDRTIGGVTVSHTLQWVYLENQLGSSVRISDMQVGIPVDVQLDGTTLNDDNSQGDNHAISLGGAPTAKLVFALDRPADECVATLYQVNATSLAALRTYQAVSMPPVEIHIDTSVFAGPAGTKYIFGIQCRAGLPNARLAGDESQIAYPFSTSTTFPSAFTVQ